MYMKVISVLELFKVLLVDVGSHIIIALEHLLHLHRICFSRFLLLMCISLFCLSILVFDASWLAIGAV